MAELNIGLPQFEAFLNTLGIMNSCVLNKPVYKKLFQEASDGKKSILDAIDKACLKDDINKIRWIYILKPSTINIAAYIDDLHVYPEVAVLHIELSNPARIKRIASFINRAIPYPLILLFTQQRENKTQISIHVADKRINQVDKEKWVVEELLSTHWISLSEPDDQESEFLKSLVISNLDFRNFYEFYQSIIERVVAINCALQTGTYTLNSPRATPKYHSRLEQLQALETLQSRKAELVNKLKREKQLGKQIDLNTKIKKINDEIGVTKASL